MNKKIFNSPEEVAKDFATYFVKLVEEKDQLNVALSGGSTPKILFDLLAKEHSDLAWDKVHFYWGDERCVPPTDDDSNYKMTVDHLLSKIEMPEANIHRVLGEADSTTEAVNYGKQISANLPESNGLPRFDLVILGMGADGHTASIFPHEIELLNSDNICEVATHPDSGQKRITLTGKVINNAESICFLVTGASKAEKVNEIFHKTGNWQGYPAAYIQPLAGDLTWYMDPAAAEKL